MNALEQYYSSFDEENRLLSQHGQVEFLTTMRYIHRYLQPGMRILEVGAGTGRYSLALAHKGYRVDAIELVEKNLNILLCFIASDGATNYMRDTVDSMDDHTFQLYLDYHFSVCERQDLIGASDHSLDILRKV